MGGLPDKTPLVGPKMAENYLSMGVCLKQKLSFAEAKRRSRIFPDDLKSKAQKVAQKQAESLPLEAAERRASGLPKDGFRTAERLLIFDRPISGPKHLGNRKGNKTKYGVTVYLLRFTPKLNTDEEFLKIGITNTNVGERFGFDSYRYKISELDVLKKLTRKEALRVESTLHRMFSDMQYVPKLRLLSGGNSECFYDHEGIVERVDLVFSMFRDELQKLGR